VRYLASENWEPWSEESYEMASSVMMIQKTGAEAMSCRIIKLEPSGHTAMHHHPRVHHVLALEGSPELETEEETIRLESLVAVEIPSNVPHRFVNRDKENALILVLNVYRS